MVAHFDSVKKGSSMTRKKVKLSWISKDAARRASFRKRSASLIKKVKEVSILCGVNSCIIIYSPDDVTPMTWPSPESAIEVLTRFHEVPEIDRSKKMIDEEGYMKDRVDRVEKRLRKAQARRKEMETRCAVEQIVEKGRLVEDLSAAEMECVARWIEEKRREIGKRVLPKIPPPEPWMMNDYWFTGIMNNSNTSLHNRHNGSSNLVQRSIIKDCRIRSSNEDICGGNGTPPLS